MYGKCSKNFEHVYLSDLKDNVCFHMTVIYKLLVRITNSPDPDQTASECLSRPFWQATSVCSHKIISFCTCLYG